jgi:hypothetical protein
VIVFGVEALIVLAQRGCPNIKPTIRGSKPISGLLHQRLHAQNLRSSSTRSRRFEALGQPSFTIYKYRSTWNISEAELVSDSLATVFIGLHGSASIIQALTPQLSASTAISGAGPNRRSSKVPSAKHIFLTHPSVPTKSHYLQQQCYKVGYTSAFSRV